MSACLTKAVEVVDSKRRLIEDQSWSDIRSLGIPPIVGEMADERQPSNRFFYRERGWGGYKYFRHWPYAAVNQIAKRGGCQPMILSRRRPDAGPGSPEQESFSAIHTKDLPLLVKAAVDIRDEDVLERITSGPVLEFLNRPNPVQSRFEFTYATIVSLFMTGEAYIIGGQNRDGQPEAWAIPTHWMIPEHRGELYSGYRFRPDNQGEGIFVPAENVCRVYNPDPTDPRGCISPILTQLEAIICDGYIQNAQKRGFENGVNPGVMLRVGRIGGKDKNPRRTLKPHQRRQLMEAVRRIYGGVARTGEPLIVDSLIEDAQPFTRSNREMDYNTSGELVRKRIFMAMAVNPIILGEITDVNRAQSAAADGQFVTHLLNPLLEQLSIKVGPFMLWVAQAEAGLHCWYEPARARDEELAQKDWQQAVDSGAVTLNEFRTNRLGLGPVPWGNMLARATTASHLNAVNQILRTVGEGLASTEQAASVLSSFLGISESEAEKMVIRPPGSVPMPNPRDEARPVVVDEAAESDEV